MKKVTVEWRYFAKGGKTCKRCSGTKNNIQTAINDLQRELSTENVSLELKETILPESKIPESNSVLIDGVPIEQVLPSTTKGESECCSCGDLCGKPTDCRTVNRDGQVFEELPTTLIKEAILNRIKLDEFKK